MSEPGQASNKLDKLFRLDFYKKQERWKLKNTKSNTKSNASDTTEHANINNNSTEEKNCSLKTDDEPTTVAPPVLNHSCDGSQNAIVKNDAVAEPVKCHQSVSTRLHLFLTLSQKVQAEPNDSEAYVDSGMSIDGVPLNSQEDLNLKVFEENILMDEGDKVTPSYYYESSMTNQEMGYDGDAEHDNTGDDWAEVNYPYSPMQNINDPKMNMESASCSHDNSYVNFMREAHDVPHSSDLQLDFQDGPNDIDHQRLAELSPWQLWVGLNRYTVALQKLVEETTFRKVLYQDRQYQSLCAFGSFSEEDTILAASFYTVDENQFRRRRRTRTTYD